MKTLGSALGGAINNFAHFESMQKGLETFFQDADKGKAKFEELRKMSNETTFGVDELANSFTQLANVGVNVDTIQEKLMMLGDVSQGNKQKFADLVSIYAKIQSTGKAGSEQLQMLAMRGLPIYDMLKKIGVQGTATGNDITRALQEMTKEGGQFHNAMNNINDTIEGKRGFVSDYLKEASVNFAELTGIADAYKKALDVIVNVVGTVSDKLLEWNENPVMKAIISGAFVSMITALGGVIAVSIIPKLIAVIGHLTTINLLSGPAGWAVLAVAGITAVGVAMLSYKNSTKEAKEETEKLAKAVEDAKKKMGNNYGLLNVGVNPTETRSQKYQNESNTLKLYEDNLANFTSKLEDAEKKVTSLKQKIENDGGGITGYEERYKTAQEEVNKWKDAIEKTNNSIMEQQKKVNALVFL